MLEASERSVRLPNILVYIELRAGTPTRPSLFALAEARRVARAVGASVFALCPSAPLSSGELEALAAPIAGAGADKLLLCEADSLGQVPTEEGHGATLLLATARVPPLMVLFPAGGTGPALGPPLAVRLGGPYYPHCDLIVGGMGAHAGFARTRASLVRVQPDGRIMRRADPVDLERPVVATLGAGAVPAATGNVRDLEIEVIAGPPADPDRQLATELGRQADPLAELALAAAVVLVSPGELIADADATVGALRASAAADVFVARADTVDPDRLRECCPELVLKLGPTPIMTARSPRTRVVMVAPAAGVGENENENAPPTSTPEDVDVVWQLRPQDGGSPEALAALVNSVLATRSDAGVTGGSR